MFRKKTDENREIILQSFYNLEDRLTQKLGANLVNLAFTASDSNTNKTMHIVNIAKHFAEDGDRVLVVDANLRKSELPSATDYDNERGFIDILLGDYDFESVIVKDRSYKDLSYIYTGKVTDYADKFLEASDIRAFYQNARDRFDYVLIDLTPNVGIPEANMFAANADCSVVFTNNNLSNSSITRDSIKELEKSGAKVLGLIITDYEYEEDELDDLFGGYDE